MAEGNRSGFLLETLNTFNQNFESEVKSVISALNGFRENRVLCMYCITLKNQSIIFKAHILYLHYDWFSPLSLNSKPGFHYHPWHNSTIIWFKNFIPWVQFHKCNWFKLKHCYMKVSGNGQPSHNKINTFKVNKTEIRLHRQGGLIICKICGLCCTKYNPDEIKCERNIL